MSQPQVSSFDVAAVRSRFPSLRSGIAHFDAPGGTQTPTPVGAAIADTLTGPLSNRGSRVASERNADATVAAFRQAYADLLNADPDGIVYGRSATQLTYDFSRHLSKDWTAADEIVLCRLDHDANVRPWVQAAEHTGAAVRWLDFDPATGELDLSALDACSERTRLVALTAASNLIGTRPPVAVVAERAHAVGALVYVDGVHYTAHTVVDLDALGADFFVCSPYKFFGPHCAVLAAAPALLEGLQPDKLLPSTDQVPERFEFGTLPYETMAGATAAVDFLADLLPGPGDRRQRLLASLSAVETHESALGRRIDDGLRALDAGVVLHAVASDRTPTQLLTVPGRSMAKATEALAARDVLAPSGTFYAYEPARRLALEDPAPMRVGVAAYSDDSDVDRLLDGLAAFLG